MGPEVCSAEMGTRARSSALFLRAEVITSPSTVTRGCGGDAGYTPGGLRLSILHELPAACHVAWVGLVVECYAGLPGMSPSCTRSSS